MRSTTAGVTSGTQSVAPPWQDVAPGLHTPGWPVTHACDKYAWSTEPSQSSSTPLQIASSPVGSPGWQLSITEPVTHDVVVGLGIEVLVILHDVPVEDRAERVARPEKGVSDRRGVVGDAPPVPLGHPYAQVPDGVRRAQLALSSRLTRKVFHTARPLRARGAGERDQEETECEGLHVTEAT